MNNAYNICIVLIVASVATLWFHCIGFDSGVGIGQDDPDLYRQMIDDSANLYTVQIDSVERVDSFHQRIAQENEIYYYYELNSKTAGGITANKRGRYYTVVTPGQETTNIDSLVIADTDSDQLFRRVMWPVRLDDGSVMYSVPKPACSPENTNPRGESIYHSHIGLILKRSSCFKDMDGYSNYTVLLEHNGKNSNAGKLLNEFYAKRDFLRTFPAISVTVPKAPVSVCF